MSIFKLGSLSSHLFGNHIHSYERRGSDATFQMVSKGLSAQGVHEATEGWHTAGSCLAHLPGLSLPLTQTDTVDSSPFLVAREAGPAVGHACWALQKH